MNRTPEKDPRRMLAKQDCLLGRCVARGEWDRKRLWIYLLDGLNRHAFVDYTPVYRCVRGHLRVPASKLLPVSPPG
jgi:hypothetical protein